jgi:hypothetical protein
MRPLAEAVAYGVETGINIKPKGFKKEPMRTRIEPARPDQPAGERSTEPVNWRCEQHQYTKSGIPRVKRAAT